MGADALNAVTGLDVLLLLAAIVLGFALYRAALSIDERLMRTRGLPRVIWVGVGLILLGGGLWALSLTSVLPFRSAGYVEYALLPALLSSALAVVGVAAALLALELERPLPVRLAVGGLLWGGAVAAIHFLTLDALGWRTAVMRDPLFSLQVLVAALLGAVVILWAVLAQREQSPRRRWFHLLATAASCLAGPAAVYSAYVLTRAAPRGTGALTDRADYLLDPLGILVTACGVALAAGAVVAAAGVDRKLRQRRAETEALRRSEDRFRSLIQASSQIVWTTDPNGEMCGEQTSWAQFTGQDATAYRGWGWFNAVHPDDREATASLWQSSLANRTPVELEHRVRRRDGQYRDCLARVVPVLEPDGRVREWVGTHTDVTERARMQEERDLLASAGRVISSSLDERETLSAIASLLVPRLADWCAVDIRDPEGGIERVVATHSDPHRATLLREIRIDRSPDERGHGAARVLATGESEMFREVDDDVLRTIAADEQDFQRLREVGVASLLTVPLVARRQVLGVLTLALSDGGEPYDLRDLALAEELGRRSAIAIDNARLYSASRAAIQARDEMMSIVSHDLRNPLSTIMMTSDLLLELPANEEEQRRHLQTIGRAAGSMNRLIRDLLDAGQAESGRLAVERTPLSPAPLALETCEAMKPLATERGLRLLCEVEEDLPEVWGDPARLEQVLSNLIGNAIKFVPEDGSIRLRVTRGDGAVRFSVEDDGPGIPPEDLPHIFDRHWRGKKNAHLGAGLGLAIARAIVEAHDGRIWVESEPDHGTAFHFTIPILSPGREAANEERGDEVAEERTNGGRRSGADVHAVAGDR